MSRSPGRAKWVAPVLAAASLLVASAFTRPARAQQHTFHLDRLEVPGAPDDGLVLFRPVTHPQPIFYAQLGIGFAADPLRMSNFISDAGTLNASAANAVTTQFSTYLSAGFEVLNHLIVGATFPAAW